MKRKHSETDSDNSLLSLPLSSSKFMPMDSFLSPQAQIRTPSLFHSRTRKRHRDNRPSESEVHQHTLSLLYSAQQNPLPRSQSPALFQPRNPIASLPSTSQSTQQSSLHSFWAIPSARQSSPLSNCSRSSSNTLSGTPAPPTSFLEAANCEDCDAPLNLESGGDSIDGDMMIDVDIDGGDHACTSCRKQVCHSCAVSNLGAQRTCLNCAGKKKIWVAGLGWMDRD